MRKLFLVALLIIVMAVSACSLGQYFPSTNNTTDMNDSFELTEDLPFTPVENGTIIDLTDDEPEENVTDDTPDLEPVLTTIEVTEGETADLSFLNAEDPDGDSIRFSYSEPFASNGHWETEDGDEGTYLIRVTASDGVLSTTENVRVIVNPSNKGPVIDCPALFSVQEGMEFDLPCEVYDREGDDFTYEVTGYLDSFSGEVGYDDAGRYEVHITATDGNKETEHTLFLEVEDVNRAPVVEDVENIIVTEGEFVILELEVSDPDGDDVEITYPVLFNNDGFWETQRGDAGNYQLEAEVTDGDAVVTVPIEIVVEQLNLPPVMEELDDITVQEGDTINLEVEVSDPEGEDVVVTYSGWMTTQEYTTTYDDAGEYEVTITASDGRHTVEQTVGITVENVNRPPVFITG